MVCQKHKNVYPHKRLNAEIKAEFSFRIIAGQSPHYRQKSMGPIWTKNPPRDRVVEEVHPEMLIPLTPAPFVCHPQFTES